MSSDKSASDSLEDCDSLANVNARIACEERNLDRLTKQYANLRSTIDKNYPADSFRRYRSKAFVCLAAFIAAFAISYLFSPHLPFLHFYNYGNIPNSTTLRPENPLQNAILISLIFNDKIIFSVIAGICAAIVLIMIFVLDNTLKTQRLNEMLSAKSFEIRMRRSKILSLLHQDEFEQGTNTSGDTNV